ncbi:MULTISPECIES: SDR family oxidoreductase [Legionella]|uniref:Oxidoreductase n=1 Tax=Legionella drozanskii LLAP-1 TaxID=1212489 RepID=A0A0W0SVZ4_9GAMM|nr:MULTISPECIES: SDR family oxidoreductase [Legionella]KTC87520.1 oxidoreductase [Legionella drozanskii LLAP-1]
MKTILITGASRGLGLEFARQLSAQGENVIATCRHPAGASVLQDLGKKRDNLSIITLDVSDERSIARLVDLLGDRPIDWLINNAGITGTQGVTIGNIERENFLNVMNVNCFGALKVSEALLPNLLKSEDKLIVNMTSRLGSISDNQWGRAYAYRASKAALNCVMHAFAMDVAELGVKVLLLHPGWVQTELGGSQADIDAATSITAMLKVIEANKTNSHADVMHTYEGKTVDW